MKIEIKVSPSPVGHNEIGNWKPEEIFELIRIIERHTQKRILDDAAQEWIDEEKTKEPDYVFGKKRKNTFTKVFEVAMLFSAF